MDQDNSDTYTFSKICSMGHDSDVSMDSNTGEFFLTKDYDLDVPGTETDFNCSLTVTDGGGFNGHDSDRCPHRVRERLHSNLPLPNDNIDHTATRACWRDSDKYHSRRQRLGDACARAVLLLTGSIRFKWRLFWHNAKWEYFHKDGFVTLIYGVFGEYGVEGHRPWGTLQWRQYNCGHSYVDHWYSNRRSRGEYCVPGKF